MLLWNHREQECVILKHLCGIFQLEIGVYIHWEEKKCLTPCCTVSVAQRDSPNPDCSQCRSNSPNTAAPNQRHVFLINYIPTFIKIMTCYIKNSVLHRLVSAVIRRRQAPDWSRICSQTSWACDDYHIKRGSTARQLFHVRKGTTMVAPQDSNPTEKQCRCHKPAEWLSEWLSLCKALGMSNATMAPHRVEILQI